MELLLSASAGGGFVGFFFIVILLAIWIGFAYWVYTKIGKQHAFWLTLLFSIAGACFSALLAIAENSRDINEKLGHRDNQ